MNSDGSEMISRVKRIYLRENKKENLFEFRLFQRRPSDGINFRKEKEKTYYGTKSRTYFLLYKQKKRGAYAPLILFLHPVLLIFCELVPHSHKVVKTHLSAREYLLLFVLKLFWYTNYNFHL